MNMKKLLALFAVCALFLTACQPDPVLTLSKEALEFDPEGGTQSLRVSSNYAWNAILENDVVKVSPTGAAESADVAITLPANTTGKVQEYQVVFVCANKDMSSTKVLNIAQNCEIGSFELTNIEYNPPREGRHFSPEGGTALISFTANASWTLKCRQSDVTLDLEQGPAGSFQVLATVPACPVFEGRKVEFDYSASTQAGTDAGMFGFNQDGGIIVYGGEVYHAVKMKDGKWWMSENLRYVPQGMTPSSDLNNVTAGVYYPLVMNADNTGLAFSTDAAVIKAKGYLYQAEVALGKKVGDLTSVEAAEALNGTQGICPKGWHVPTGDDIINLVGKAVSPLATKTDAPYYDGNNGSIVLLNQDGFNMDALGAISIQDNTKTAGTFMGWAKAYPEKISSGMFCGSTYAGVSYNTKDDPTSGVKNLQFFGFMPMTNKATEAEYTCNGSKVSYRIAAPLRCVKDN